MTKKTIYGWDELTEKSYGFFAVKINNNKFQVINKKTGEIKIKDINYLVNYDQARWFTSFNSARKAMINELLVQIKWREEAIKDIKMYYGRME